MPQLRRPRPAWLLAPLVGLASLFAYRGEIRSPFVIDDWMYLGLSQSSQWHGYVDDPSSSVYRPGLMTWFVSGYHLVGLHASAFRVAAFGVLLINAGLVAWICRRFGLSPAAAAIGAAVYALHPAIVGGVSWVSAVNALLVATFALVAALVLCVPSPRWWRWVVAGLAALLALFMREDAAVLILAVPGVRLAWLAQRESLPRNVKSIARAAVPLLPLAAVVLAYGLLRLAVGASTKGTAYETGTKNLWPNALRALEYAAVWPMRASGSALPTHRLEAEGLLFGAVLLGLSVLVVRRRPLALAGCWWALLGAGPSLLLTRHAVEPYYLDLVVPGLALAVAAIAQAAGDLWKQRGLSGPAALAPAVVAVLVVVGMLLAHNVNVLQHKRSLLPVFAARGQQLLTWMPASVPANAVLCVPQGTKRDFAIAENGEMFRVVRQDHSLGLVVVQPDGSTKVSYGSGPATLTGRPVVVLADPSKPAPDPTTCTPAP